MNPSKSIFRTVLLTCELDRHINMHACVDCLSLFYSKDRQI